MKIDQNKLRELVTRERPAPSPDALRRVENVFLVGGDLPERETLETLFESHFQSHAALFHLTFGEAANFQNGETLARMIKKNFNAHLVGRLEYPAPPQAIARAYAAGVDIIDIPLTAFGRAKSEEGMTEWRAAIDHASAVFPRWSVVSSLTAGVEPASATIAGIDALLAADVVPLVTLSRQAAKLPADEISRIFSHLQAGWCRKKAAIKPLLPLIYVSTPFVPAAPRGVVRGLIDSIEDRRLLAASDLRRILRVKEVEESFESAGL